MGYVRIDNASPLAVSPFTKNKDEIDEINRTADSLVEKITPTMDALAKTLLEMHSGNSRDSI